MQHITKHFLLLLALLAFGFSACDDSDDDPEPSGNGNGAGNAVVKTITDLPADTGGARGEPADYTYFNLSTGEIVPDADSNSTKWDLALSSTTILVNGGSSGPGQGGAQILEKPFDQVKTAPESGFQEGQVPKEWYNYTGENEPKRAILIVPGRTIVVRTAEGQYAKIEIISYYQGNPDTSTEKFADLETRAESRFYTFRYALQSDGSTAF